MTDSSKPGIRPVPPLYITDDHECSYLPDRVSRTLFVDPLTPMSGNLYGHLLHHGFRRSGSYVYRPHCADCDACVPVRIPVHDFTPNRSQRRARRDSAADTTVAVRPALFDRAHYRLYRGYVTDRHADGSMADATEESYLDFLLAPWGGETRLLELRVKEHLMAVAVTDLVEDGLSAVYTFFDPLLTDRAPGTRAILHQIDWCATLGLDYLYLGYWIEGCRKMSYKDRFRPIEALMAGRWQRFERADTLQSG